MAGTKVTISPDLSATFSQSLPNTDNASLDSVQLHELAILREQGKPGPWAFKLITEYLNRKHGHEWTTKQIVDVWKKLRQEYEKEALINPGHVLLAWRGDYEDVSEPGKIPVLRAIHEETMMNFFAVMESEIERSSLSLDLELEREGEGGVTVLTSLQSVKEGYAKLSRRPWTKEDTELWSDGLYRHPLGMGTTDQNSVKGQERIERHRAFQADMYEYKRAVANDNIPIKRPYKEDGKYKEIAAQIVADRSAKKS
ncbi:MAG: hypothetical protein Q9199_002825 [Rusavskia elegans]